jgi:F-type H+-transporting ATPase subunit epsilon
MARTTFKAEILTPEGEVFSDEVEMVSTRTETGSIGILAKHQPLLGMLAPTELRLYKSESEILTFAQGEGYVQVSDGNVLLLVEEAVPADQLDRALLEDQLREAEASIEATDEGSEARSKAERDKRRVEAFLRVAGGGAAA